MLRRRYQRKLKQKISGVSGRVKSSYTWFISDRRLEPLSLYLTRPAWVRYKFNSLCPHCCWTFSITGCYFPVWFLVWCDRASWLLLIGIGWFIDNGAPTNPGRL